MGSDLNFYYSYRSNVFFLEMINSTSYLFLGTDVQFFFSITQSTSLLFLEMDIRFVLMAKLMSILILGVDIKFFMNGLIKEYTIFRDRE